MSISPRSVRLFAAFIVSLISTAAIAQRGAAPVSLSPDVQRGVAAFKAEAARSDAALKYASALCNNIGPRLSGSVQANAAAEYVASEMRALGLDVRLEPVMVPTWRRGREEAQLVAYPGQVKGTTQRLVLTTLGGSIATPADGLTAAVVVARDMDEFNRLPESAVRGKIVVFNYAFDEQMADAGHAETAYGLAVRYRGAGPIVAARKGAIAALVRSAGRAGHRMAHTGVTRYLNDVPKIPAAALAAEDAEMIATLAAQGEVRMHLLLTPETLPDSQSYNVVADLKGSEHPEEIVIVSGHLDSWDIGTGALDDASGVATAMEVVRTIKAAGLKPKRTIRMIAWMNEENGDRGGETYAEQHKAELQNHIAAIEMDLGDGHPLGLNVAGPEPRLLKINSALHAVADPIGGVNVTKESPAVDIAFINEAGVPGIAPVQESGRYFDYHHTAADTFDKIRPQELKRSVEILGALTYALASE